MSVLRVHNRWLRNRFEKKLSQVADTSDAAHKRSLEYLFMGEHPALPGEVDRALEHGFRSPGSLAALVREGSPFGSCPIGSQVKHFVNYSLNWSNSLILIFQCTKKSAPALYLILPSLPPPSGPGRRRPSTPPPSPRLQGLDAAVVLSNNVEMADTLRLQSALELSGSGSGLAVGRIMVVKAYLGKTASDKTAVDEKYLGTK